MLDVGCGTGTHALHLARAGCAVVGCDLDEGVIDVARGKAAGITPPPQFHCLPIEAIEASEFDLAVSLFNVVNYLGNQQELTAFFAAIRRRLRPGAPYIFDCWNGLAALLDPPRHKQTRIDAEGETLMVDTVPQMDLMNQAVRMTNRVSVIDSEGGRRNFSYDYTSHLWTPWHLRQVLAAAGMRTQRIVTWSNPQLSGNASGEASGGTSGGTSGGATERDWKILFVCQRE